MDKQELPVLDLDSLNNGIPAIPPKAEGYYVQNCKVCLDSQGHGSGVSFLVKYGRKEYKYKLAWKDQVTSQERRAYADLQDATEISATAIAFLLIRTLTEYTVIERSKKGTTVDYFLSEKGMDDKLIFNKTPRLEVTGILQENQGNPVTKRVANKLKRLKLFDDDLPTYIVVVEHGMPWAKMVKHT